MKEKHATPIVKRRRGRTTSTRNAVETAIDFAKANRPWQSTKEIKPWSSSKEDDRNDKGESKRLLPTDS